MKTFWGPLGIAAASVIWATDALFRVSAVQALDPVLLVLVEHALGLLLFLLLLAWGGKRMRAGWFELTPLGWLSAVLVGGGASALATIFFTASFRHLNPSVSILLQKLQPVFAVIFSRVLLREKMPRGFLPWAVLALTSGMLLSFPDLNFGFLSRQSWNSPGVSLALSAAVLWAAGTVFGKFLVRDCSAVVASFWRFLFGFLALLALLLLSHEAVAVRVQLIPLVTDLSLQLRVLYLGWVVGGLAMLFYYSGLARVSASSATFIELIFPVAAVLLNWHFLGASLHRVQLLAAATLIFSVTQIVRISRSSS